jgi:hypothetical protein
MNLTAPNIKAALSDIEETQDLLEKAMKLAGLVLYKREVQRGLEI